MVAFKRALALGLAVTALSQVSYASTGLEDLKEAAPKVLSAKISSSALGESKVKKTFGRKVKSFFNDLFSCIKETSAVIETAAPLVQAGLTVAGDISGNSDVKKAAIVTGTIGHMAHDVKSADEINADLIACYG